MIRNLLALLGLGAVALAAAVALQAYGGFDDRDQPRRLRVSYEGLDLTSPAGIRILERRINAAIAEVCPDEAGALATARSRRDCRRDAIAGVAPQVDAAVARAYDRRAADAGPPPAGDLRAPPLPAYDRPDPPGDGDAPVMFGPPAEVVQPLPSEYRHGRLLRRTVTTTTVTTSRPTPPPALRRAPPPRPAPRYGRTAPVGGSWLPPSAWRAADRATVRAFATGRLTRWHVRDREGYVTVSPPRRLNGCTCRNVRVVKHAGTRQIVVAQGTRCRRPGGGLTG